MPLSRRYRPEWAPGEGASIGMDFSPLIPPGVGIASHAINVLINSIPPAPITSADFTFGDGGIEGRIVWQFMQGGVPGRDYQIHWEATDTNGNIWPRTALLLCADTS